MFTLTTHTGERQGDLFDLLAAADASELADLPAMAPEWRPGVVTSLAIVRTVLRLYGQPSDWTADCYRRVWDDHIGTDARRIVAPLNEPALFQPPLSNPRKAAPEPIEHATGFAAKQHIAKTSASAQPAQTWLLGILGGTWRPYAKGNRSTVRASTLVVLPSNGTLGSEIVAVSKAMAAQPRPGSPRDHFPWLATMPAKPPALAALPSPVLDIERPIRLLDDGTAVREPTQGQYLDNTIQPIDPHMGGLVVGKHLRPWRPRKRWLDCVVEALAGSEEVVRPAIMGVIEDYPLVRVCQLRGEQGKTRGYFEQEVAIPPKTRSVFARSPSRVAELAAAIRTAQSQLGRSLYGAVRVAVDHRAIADEASKRAQASAAAQALTLLLDLADQEAIHRLMRRIAEGLYTSYTAQLPWLAQARGHRHLRRSLRDHIPLPDDNAMASNTNDRPALVRQAHGAMFKLDARINDAERARLRTTQPGEFNLEVMALVLSACHGVPEGDVAHAWEAGARLLGDHSVGRTAVGRALASACYPADRVERMLGVGGQQLRDLVHEAAGWLPEEGVRLGDLLALMLADASGDREALDWQRRHLAADFIRAQAEATAKD